MHRALAPSRAHIQPDNLGAVAVAHQLRVSYPENADPGTLFWGFFLYYKVYILCWSHAQQRLLEFWAVSAHVLLRYAKHQLTEI